MSHHEAPRRTMTAGPAHQGTASVASISSSTTALTAAVALAATAASVEGLAELIWETGITHNGRCPCARDNHHGALDTTPRQTTIDDFLNLE